MKAFVTSITILLISSFTLAAKVEDLRSQYTSIASQATALRNNINGINTNVEALQTRLREQQASVRAAQKRMQENKVSQTIKTGWFTPEYSVQDLPRPEDVKAYEAAVKEQRELENKIGKAQIELRRLQTQLVDKVDEQSDASKAVASAEKELADQRAAYRANMKLWSLEHDFSRVKTNLLTNNEIINEISKNYDQRVMGVYLREKMQRLLESDAMCDYVKKTASTGQCQKPGTTALDSVFVGGTKGRSSTRATSATTGRSSADQ